jgi:hypothetical protein
MKYQEIKEMAREKEILLRKIKEMQLIREFQQAEGSQPCFGTKKSRYCGQYNCPWRDDCLNAK